MEPSRHDPSPPDRPGLTWLSQVRLPESGACGQPERKDQGDAGPAGLDLHGRLWRVAIS